MKAMSTSRSAIAAWAAAACAAALLVIGAAARAENATTIRIAIKDHRFEPTEITGPAGKPLMLRVENRDATPAEFESTTLRVEKVIAGNSEVPVNLRPLKPGRYTFFDDFHKATTVGTLVVQ